MYYIRSVQDSRRHVYGQLQEINDFNNDTRSCNSAIFTFFVNLVTPGNKEPVIKAETSPFNHQRRINRSKRNLAHNNRIK